MKFYIGGFGKICLPQYEVLKEVSTQLIKLCWEGKNISEKQKMLGKSIVPVLSKIAIDGIPRY